MNKDQRSEAAIPEGDAYMEDGLTGGNAYTKDSLAESDEGSYYAEGEVGRREDAYAESTPYDEDAVYDEGDLDGGYSEATKYESSMTEQTEMTDESLDESNASTSEADNNTTKALTEGDTLAADGVNDADDVALLKAKFPELGSIGSTAELRYPEKYARFRRMGLSATEAYLATGQGRARGKIPPASPLSVTGRKDGIPQRELRVAREIFTGLSDREIQALYKRVTKK